MPFSNEQLKFAAGYGYGNLRRREVVTPYNQFRVGSVSKPITAAAIMILVDQGRVELSKRVFGGTAHDSIFGWSGGGSGTVILRKKHSSIANKEL